MIISEVLPVADSPVGEERREAITYRINQCGWSSDIQVGFLLSCKRSVWQVFSGSGRAYRYVCDIMTVLPGEFHVGADDPGAEFMREFGITDCLADTLSRASQGYQ